MKKTLIALAAVAATSASFAQSSVTLAGQVETGLEKRFSGDPTRMTSNRNGTSNWTLRGTEDLGGGMRAVFQVSTQFLTDTGEVSSANGLGNNGMFVGVTGGFGTLRAGRPTNTLFANALFANGTKGVSLHDSNTVLSGPPTAPGLIANAGSSVYVANGVQYHTPVMGGFQVQLEYAPSELANASAGTGVAIRYAHGPVIATFTNYKGAGTASLLKPKAVNQLAGSYDFKVARVFATFRDDANMAKNADTGYAIGLTAPVGPGSVYVSYNVREQAGADGKTAIAGYKYDFSKRTLAFVNVAQRSASWLPAAVTAAGGTGNKSTKGFGFGLQHSF